MKNWKMFHAEKDKKASVQPQPALAGITEPLARNTKMSAGVAEPLTQGGKTALLHIGFLYI